MAHVVVKDLFKQYGDLQVVHGINFEIGDGEFVVLVGPSGCGKSTILRMIAGLETVTGGEIVIDGKVVNDIPPRERDIAMVFQDYALYPHMSVRQNLGFGLKMRGTARAAIKAAVERTAAILQIEGLLERKPKELSGGQRQRVAIGRAIAREPRLFLFDEPLSNLDAQLRVEMRTQIKRLHMKLSSDQRLRHARPDRGDDAGRPHRRSPQRRHRADGHAGGALRQPGQSLRRRLHRLAEDELPEGKAHGGERRAVCDSGRRAGDKTADPPTGQCADRPGRRHRHSPRAPLRHLDGAWS